MQGKVWTILLNKLFDTICILSKKMSCATSIINGVRHILAVFYQLLQRQRSYNETHNRHRSEELALTLLYAFCQESLEQVAEKLMGIRILQAYVLQHKDYFS